ncbi:polysaccharide biosynthesis tyrosine autokinase [Singulisphaera sp. Ch08]|uniref:non-specific protein-tyrosine kinase n=1 Tax=Singulisphaera sp. Ch08 TaxID=3120278 RepID=A0AAU7C6R9_9BACT
MLEIQTPSTSSPTGMIVDPANLIAILWRGRRLIAASILGCLLLAGFYLLNTDRIYQATAKLLILQQGGRPLSVVSVDTGGLTESGEDYIPTHALVLKSPIVVRHAIEAVGLKNLASLDVAGNMERAVRDVTKSLSVTRPDRLAKILQIDFRAKSREEAVRLVAAITLSYKKFLEEVYQKNNSDVVFLMTKARDDLNNELKDLEQKYKEFRLENPLLTSDGTGRPLIARRIDEWNRATTESMVRAVQLKEQLELGRKLAQDGVGLGSITYAMDQLAGSGSSLGGRNPSFNAAAPSDYVRQLNQEQQRLTDRHGPQNTKVKEIQEQITSVLEQSRSSRNRIDQVEIRELLDSIEGSLRSVISMREKIADQFEKDMTDAKKAEIALLNESILKSNLERQRALFNGVVDQLKQAKLVGDFSGIRSQTIEEANALPKAVSPLFSLTLVVALVVGGVLGTGGALVSDLLDPRIRSLEEIRKVLQLPMLGQIPQLPESPTPRASSVGLICHAMPRSPSAEAYKVARANLDLARRNRGVRVVLVTSPHASEGKSTVASNLAICQAQAGRRVLLVDADLRRPAQHKIYGMQRERGLVHILRDLMSIARVVQTTTIKNLDLIASGPEATNPAELLSSPFLHDFLNKVREDYDTVIIDSPSLLEVADPSILGAVADGIVLVVRASETKRDEATRALEVLKELGIPILGALVNGSTPGPATRLRVPTAADSLLTERRTGEIRPEPKLSFAFNGTNGAHPRTRPNDLPSPDDATEGPA